MGQQAKRSVIISLFNLPFHQSSCPGQNLFPRTDKINSVKECNRVKQSSLLLYIKPLNYLSAKGGKTGAVFNWIKITYFLSSRESLSKSTLP